MKDNNVSIGVSRSLYFSEANVLLFGGSIELKYISNFKDNYIGVIGANVMVLYMSTGLNISNKYIEPNMGFDLKFLRLDIGYAINYTRENHVTFGVRANIPLLFLD